MRTILQIALAALCVACRTQPLDLAELEAEDMSHDIVDMAVAPPVDAGPCVPPNVDAGACPCGTAGLCRPATGRVSAQVSSGGGLSVVVMDDNGCNLRIITSDHPFSPPRWNPDHERLAYLTDGDRLHVVRVDPYGNVACRADWGLSFHPTDLAWASATDVWLFAPGVLVRWQIGMGQVGTWKLNAVNFDAALAPGPLLIVDQSCGMGCTALKSRSDVTTGDFTQLTTAMASIGPIRLSSDGQNAVFELMGVHYYPTAGGTEQSFGVDGDHSPVFAFGNQAVLYTANNDELHYHSIVTPNDPDLTVPSSWKKIYGPEWAPLPDVCNLPPTCF